MLHAIDLSGICEPQDSPDVTVDDVAVGCSGDEASQADTCSKVELSDLLVERHLPEKSLGARRLGGGVPTYQLQQDERGDCTVTHCFPRRGKDEAQRTARNRSSLRRSSAESARWLLRMN